MFCYEILQNVAEFSEQTELHTHNPLSHIHTILY